MNPLSSPVVHLPLPSRGSSRLKPAFASVPSTSEMRMGPSGSGRRISTAVIIARAMSPFIKGACDDLHTPDTALPIGFISVDFAESLSEIDFTACFEISVGVSHQKRLPTQEQAAGIAAQPSPAGPLSQL